MGLFDFLKKKSENKEQVSTNFDELKAFSIQAINLAKSEIEETGSFLPFGGVFTTDNNFQMVVYHDPSKTTIDHREHATIIQKLIMEKYKDPRNIIFFMAWDGVAHLKTGDLDCINVKVDNKFTGYSKIYNYTYTKTDNNFQLTDSENPTVRDV